MNWKKLVNKKYAFVAILGIFAVTTLSSCHRDGCPGQITKVSVEQTKKV